MAHIRYATQGEVSLENVHPFTRVWKGVQMCFCHNGDCPTFAPGVVSWDDASKTPLLGKTTPKDVVYHPVGDTDSEAVFCAILNALNAEFPEGLPTLPVLHEFLALLCNEILADRMHETIFNFLLGCGQYTMFAYSWPGARPGSQVWNGLHYIVREPPFTTAKLLDVDYAIDFSKVTVPDDCVAVITTKPLTEEPGWVEFKPGELIMFNKGKPYRTPKCCEAAEREGRGLRSKCATFKCTSSPSLTRMYQQKNTPTPPPLDLSSTSLLSSSPSSVAVATSEPPSTTTTTAPALSLTDNPTNPPFRLAPSSSLSPISVSSILSASASKSKPTADATAV